MLIVKSFMNTWLFFALSGPFLWAFTNIFDGALRQNFIKNDIALTWIVAASRLPFVILLFLISDIRLPGISVNLWMILAGILWTLPLFFYYRAIKDEDPSRIALLIQLVPVFTLPIAYFTIGERLTSFQIFAFIILILAGIFASLKKMKGNWRLSKAFFLIACACLSWAASDVLFKKFAVFYPNYISAYAVDMFGGFLVCLPILFMPKNRKGVFKNLSGLPVKAWLLIFLSFMAGIIGGLFYNYALTIGKASLTAVMMGIQPLFVFILGLILAFRIKWILKEDTSRESLFAKIISFGLVMIGLVLLQF
jgi:drug/metabolite transporter (DMT)-like permease